MNFDGRKAASLWHNELIASCICLPRYTRCEQDRVYEKFQQRNTFLPNPLIQRSSKQRHQKDHIFFSNSLPIKVYNSAYGSLICRKVSLFSNPSCNQHRLSILPALPPPARKYANKYIRVEMDTCTFFSLLITQDAFLLQQQPSIDNGSNNFEIYANLISCPLFHASLVEMGFDRSTSRCLSGFPAFRVRLLFFMALIKLTKVGALDRVLELFH